MSALNFRVSFVEFVSISFLVNIGKEMSLPGFRNKQNYDVAHGTFHFYSMIFSTICITSKIGQFPD